MKRGQADKDAMKTALDLLAAGETMIVFPEGGRQYGNEIGDLF
ncbi:MAG: 1-acyl-sn-glycerol-3-phosphate acyltransferase, partial [Acidimicrobiia bacterium]|nr:1-acyl-sn-glycerol-3-phosphate acyltransferase [Acidimicrobiia bacterium]